MGIAATACWRDDSDDSCVTDAKSCFGKDDLADRVLGATSTSGLLVDQFWRRDEAVDRHSCPGGDRLRGKLSCGTTEIGRDEIMTYHSGTADGWMSAARLRCAAWYPAIGADEEITDVVLSIGFGVIGRQLGIGRGVMGLEHRRQRARLSPR
jgi:hypothetical protein